MGRKLLTPLCQVLTPQESGVERGTLGTCVVSKQLTKVEKVKTLKLSP